MLNQQDSNGGKIHKGQEGSIRLVKSGGDSAKPLDFLKKTLHQMALLIQGPVYRPGIGDIAFGRNHIAGPVIRNIFPNRPGTIGPVFQHGTPAGSDLFSSSHHCAPLRMIQSIPLSMVRLPFRGRPRFPVSSGGSSGLIRSHCSFVNSYCFRLIASHTWFFCATFIFSGRPKYTPLNIVGLMPIQLN